MKIDLKTLFIGLFLSVATYCSEAQVYFAKDTLWVEVIHPDGLKENYFTPYCHGILDLNEKGIRLVFKPSALTAYKNERPHTDAWVQKLFAGNLYNWSLDAVLPLNFSLTDLPKMQPLTLKSRMGVIGETRWMESQWKLRPGKSAKEWVLDLTQDFDLNDPETGLPDKKYKVIAKVKGLVLKQREISAK